MVRTTLSFCLLFAGLLFISKWMHESVRPAPDARAATPAATPLDNSTLNVEPLPLDRAALVRRRKARSGRFSSWLSTSP